MHNQASDVEAAAHLRMWIYGHIVEASEPYELVANLLDITDGGTFVTAQFPDKNGRPESPGSKVTSIEERAARLGYINVAVPFRERWDRELRNAVFHSDYALHGTELRLPLRGSVRSQAEMNHLASVANASHDALVMIRRYYIEGYGESREIPVGQFCDDPKERAAIVVREGHGLIGVRSVPTDALGQIPWRISRGSPGRDPAARR